MADRDSLLEKVDSLIRRHRQSSAPITADDRDREQDEGDLPLLTDIVVADDLAQAPLPATAMPVPVPDIVPPDAETIRQLAREMLRDRLRAQKQIVAGELTAWLDDELPQIVMRVLDGITDQIIAQVTAEAMATLLPRMQAALDESQPSQDAG